MKKITCLWMLAALLLPGGGVAAATSHHFTFQVPVELQRIPAELNRWRVWVEIWSEPGGGNPGTGHVATGYREFSPQNGAFSSTLTVTADCETGGVARPEHANRYEVTLQIRDPRNGQWVNADSLMRTGANWPHDPAHTYRPRVSRTLTQ